ncbi:MAG: tail fiber assembly protein [Alphaproteobacteria bacterium]|nr:MAG: tail fiber assembly protein [Alphaproteobacteria bacterium]
MTIFYSAATNGFYIPEIHGDAIPADAVEITREEHEALMTANSQGKVISANAEGSPVALDPPPPSPEYLIRCQIADLERLQTPRRLREAMLTEAGRLWLADQDQQINILRGTLKDVLVGGSG